MALADPHPHGKGTTDVEPQAQEQRQTQTQGQVQETRQTQEAQAILENSGNAVAEGGSAVLNSNGDVNVNTNYKRNAPPVYVPSIHPTAPCIVTGGFGLSFPGGGGSLGGGKLDKGCEEREVARMLAGMGAIDLALDILCSGDPVERTIGQEKCDAWVLPPEMWYAHMPDEETELQEEIHHQQQVQQQQSTQIAELMRVIKRGEAQRRQEQLDKEESDRLWYEALDELEQKYE